MRVAKAFVVAGLIGFGACVAATQTLAHLFRYQAALGTPPLQVGDHALYWPWSVLLWSARWGEDYGPISTMAIRRR